MTLRYLSYLHLCLIELQISNRPGILKTSLCRSCKVFVDVSRTINLIYAGILFTNCKLLIYTLRTCHFPSLLSTPTSYQAWISCFANACRCTWDLRDGVSGLLFRRCGIHLATGPVCKAKSFCLNVILGGCFMI